MGRYDDKNLIRYEETIKLHFDRTGRMAWLTMKNYGVVFPALCGQDERDHVMEIKFGIPAGRLTKSQCDEFAVAAEMTPEEVGRMEPDFRAVSIGSMLDATAVIKFQVQILKTAQCSRTKPTERRFITQKAFTTSALYARIDSVLLSMGAYKSGYFKLEEHAGASGTWDAPPILSAMERRLLLMLRQRPAVPGKDEPNLNPGALWISGQIKSNRLNNTDFIAYFPHPRFMIEEQRTDFDQIFLNQGKTKKQDMRLIKPIPISPVFAGRPGLVPPALLPTVHPPLAPHNSTPLSPQQIKERVGRHFDFEEFLAELDVDIAANEAAFSSGGTGGRSALDPQVLARTGKYLHQHIERIDCYAFGGDDRDPAAIKGAGGFLPGVTRRDKGVEGFQACAKKIEDALDPALKGTGKSYREVMKELDILTLGVYTLRQEFKGYISATTSTVIAKSFSNAWTAQGNLFRSSYCYAVRCKGGLHLPTDAAGVKKEFKSRKHSGNALTHGAEQEVAVPGAIWWENVIGMRVVRVNRKGQFFSGPVFLSNLLRKEFTDRLAKEDTVLGERRALWTPVPDNDAFDELFELFSGKSQGAGFEIYLSYEDEDLPFACGADLRARRKRLQYTP